MIAPLLTGGYRIRQVNFNDPDGVDDKENTVFRAGDGVVSVADSDCLYMELTSRALGPATIVYAISMAGTQDAGLREVYVQIDVSQDGVNYVGLGTSPVYTTNGSLRTQFYQTNLALPVGGRIRFRGIASITGSGAFDTVRIFVTANALLHDVDYTTK